MKELDRFRLGVSSLNTHRHRCMDRSQGNYACPFCKDADEREVYFSLYVPHVTPQQLVEHPTEKLGAILTRFKSPVRQGIFLDLNVSDNK